MALIVTPCPSKRIALASQNELQLPTQVEPGPVGNGEPALDSCRPRVVLARGEDVAQGREQEGERGHKKIVPVDAGEDHTGLTTELPRSKPEWELGFLTRRSKVLDGSQANRQTGSHPKEHDHLIGYVDAWSQTVSNPGSRSLKSGILSRPPESHLVFLVR